LKSGVGAQDSAVRHLSSDPADALSGLDRGELSLGDVAVAIDGYRAVVEHLGTSRVAEEA
jgi:hypothetical protein